VEGLLFLLFLWEGNSQAIEYTFDAAKARLGVGETLNSHFFVQSNGGEKQIPFSAKLTKVSISTPDGAAITNVTDFFEFSQEFPVQARRIFAEKEFFALLVSLGHKYVEAFEAQRDDVNRERAMDNFFVLAGLKKETSLELVGERKLEFSQAPHDVSVLSGSFQVKRSDKGYVNCPLEFSADWLSLSSEKLTAADFDYDDIATVDFSIEPAKIKAPFAGESLTIGENTLEILYRRKPELVLSLNREAYRYSDRGVIEIANNTGKTLQISVFCKENYIRFAEKTFPVGVKGEIPFEVKLSAFMSAQMLFRRLPIMRSEIELKIGETKKFLPITVGEW
jgi:hypothetical protein